jgi:hypothetical protein
MKKKKLFYNIDDIIGAFDLRIGKDCKHLREWLATEYVLTDFEQQQLNELYDEIGDLVDYMNEEELKIRFVGSLFRIARVDVKDKLRLFFERPLSATINNYQLSVICDCMIATPKGYNTPQNPYFFLQEFKKKRGEKNDPEGQMLAAMLIAQQINNDQKAIYGGYLFGSSWRFTTLFETEYCQSHNFDTTRKEDVVKIIFLLKKIKELL